MSNFDTTLHILDVSLVFSLFLEVDLLLLTAQPWAERGSCSTRGLLTARPWAERGSWFTCVFFFFFADLSATRPKLPLGQILSHATCDVYSPKAVETLINLISDTDFRGKKLKTQR